MTYEEIMDEFDLDKIETDELLDRLENGEDPTPLYLAGNRAYYNEDRAYDDMFFYEEDYVIEIKSGDIIYDRKRLLEEWETEKNEQYAEWSMSR